MMPRLDGPGTGLLALTLATMTTLYLYTAWAMPHILRYIL